MAEYVISRVMRDGNPETVSRHGDDLQAALRYCEQLRKGSQYWNVNYGVCDEDDPERGWLFTD